jgi:uncharacterized protein
VIAVRGTEAESPSAPRYRRPIRGGRVVATVGGLVLAMTMTTFMWIERAALPRVELVAPRGRLLVEVADTPATRARGLSGRERLELDGLLLEWPAAGRHPIWMADMRFSLDLVWLDASGAVLAVARRVPPCTRSSCPLYEPAGTERSVAVLEVPAGDADHRGLDVGARVRRLSANGR